VSLAGGRHELERLLLERIEANGGRQMMENRAVEIHVRRGTVSGVELDGEAGPVGAGFVIADMTGEELAALAGGAGITKRAQREWPRITATLGRFVATLVVRKTGIPAALGREALLLPTRGADESDVPPIHLQLADTPNTDEALLVAETLLSDHGGLRRREARSHVVERLCAELPFLERHLVMVDSVYDGHPVWRYRDGERQYVERTPQRGAVSRIETPEPLYEVDPPGYLGLEGEPLRGPIDHTLLVGPTVLPGLGEEGQLLAAWGAARLVTRSDKRKARMRREMWTKIEIS
jgi:hypothetical protein